MNDLIVGAWRNGLTTPTSDLVNDAAERVRLGFRPLPYQETVLALSDLLDSYDEIVADFLEETVEDDEIFVADNEDGSFTIIAPGFTLIEEAGTAEFIDASDWSAVEGNTLNVTVNYDGTLTVGE